jgi:hypothetical protein
MDHVWTGLDVLVYVYYDDGNGNRLNGAGAAFNPLTDQPLLEYCYFQNVEVLGSLNAERRPVTGRVKQRIVPLDYVYEARVAALYYKKSRELNADIFNREKVLQFELKCFDPGRTGNVTDQHTLSIVKAKEFVVRSEENGIVQASATFWAEEFT